ncbi:M23 family metallopeptidase [Arcticibacter eurypsychrophilus]|uniref:M23 family metallopeptidase n=1 Tax=Arcticibacter eurypsychrophilus TaxID=1434752 RepID=UPI00084DFF58|nr:M23 family metallopeptidase [Arcticibacter eurypsychrophilus]
MKIYYLAIISVFLYACSPTGTNGLFKKASPHDQYASNLESAGLHETALGKEWLSAAVNSLNKPLFIALPYKETGYFPDNKAMATALRFEAKLGSKILISFTKKPVAGFTVYIDLWEQRANEKKKLLAYADSSGNPFEYEIDKKATYVIRLQPELLSAGEYTLTISTGPSLAFPVRDGKSQSFWGAVRDNGSRSHEGIDIFAPLRTPALAAANGIIRHVGLNNLGGKVVFLNPDAKDYSLYYAHLDEQLVQEGKVVHLGDTIGLIGNTGNARGGPTHLHFGIYTQNGAVDPYPFINQTNTKPALIKGSNDYLGKGMRTTTRTLLYSGPSKSFPELANLPKNTYVEVLAASSSWYKVLLPDGQEGYLGINNTRSLTESMDNYRLSADHRLLDRPSDSTASKKLLLRGNTVPVYASFGAYLYVRDEDTAGWIKIKP